MNTYKNNTPKQFDTVRCIPLHAFLPPSTIQQTMDVMNKHMDISMNDDIKDFVTVHCTLLYVTLAARTAQARWEIYRLQKASACAAVFTFCAKDVKFGLQQGLPALS